MDGGIECAGRALAAPPHRARISSEERAFITCCSALACLFTPTSEDKHSSEEPDPQDNYAERERAIQTDTALAGLRFRTLLGGGTSFSMCLLVRVCPGNAAVFSAPLSARISVSMTALKNGPVEYVNCPFGSHGVFVRWNAFVRWMCSHSKRLSCIHNPQHPFSFFENYSSRVSHGACVDRCRTVWPAGHQSGRRRRRRPRNERRQARALRRSCRKRLWGLKICTARSGPRDSFPETDRMVWDCNRGSGVARKSDDLAPGVGRCHLTQSVSKVFLKNLIPNKSANSFFILVTVKEKLKFW